MSGLPKHASDRMTGTATVLCISLLWVSTVLTGCQHAAPGRTGIGHRHPASATMLYQPMAGKSDQSMQGVVMNVAVDRRHQSSPVDHPLSHLKQAIEKEVRARGGTVEPEPSTQSLNLRVTVTRYQSLFMRAMPANSRHRTLIDFSTRFDHAEGRSLASQGVRSIAGTAGNPQSAHASALRRFVSIALLEPQVTSFLAEHRVSTEGLLALRLDRLSGELFERTNSALKARQVPTPIRIGLAPLKKDEANRVGAQLTPALMQQFEPPDYRFFSRTQLTSILEEQSLQMTDLVDQQTTVTSGGLQGVDYMVTGLVAETRGGLTVQLEVLSVGSGEVIGSASVMAGQ